MQFQVESQMSKLQALYREGTRTIENAQQTIIALDSGMRIATENAKASAKEIKVSPKTACYRAVDLRLGSGGRGSALRCRESQEIKFKSDQILAELSILTTLGLFAPLVGFN